MKVASLFSGIGGLDFGLEQSGHEVVLQVERDPHCVQVLQRQFPGRELVTDIAGIHVLPPDVELLAAGFPCQDVSTVNPTRPGLRNGWRTGLCSHIFRLLRNRKVPWVLLENVTGLLKWHLAEEQPQEPAISYVVEELENLGYRWAHRVISLAGFGLPQCRQRVFIVASLHGDPRDVLLSTESQCKGQCIDLNVGDASSSTRECYSCFQTPPYRNPRHTIACVDVAEKRFGPLVHEIHTLTTSNGRRTYLVQDLGDGNGKAFGLHIEDAERLSGFPPGWTESCAPLEIPGQSGTRVINPEAHVNKRFELLGLAVSVPQARWIGARLRRPYDIKFARSMQGKCFPTPIPGGDPVDHGDRNTMNAWPKVAWNMLDEDDTQNEYWMSRYALDGCKEVPVISPFIPLGDFDLRRHIEMDAEIAKGYLDRVAEHDIRVPEFVQDAFERVCGKRRRKQPGKKIDKQIRPLDDEYAGDLVWIPTKVGKRQACYWPGIALHLDKDRDLIPDDGLKALKPGETAKTHRFAIYFGDKTFEWVKADVLLDFDANAERLKTQKGMQSRAQYTKALEIAFDRLEKQTAANHHVRRKENEINQKVAENRLSERFGDLRNIPPTTCGKCNVCLSRACEREEVPFSKRHLPRGCAKPCKKAPLKGVNRGDVCPQLQIISRAKKGSIGAQLALMRERAVGQRIMMYWHVDASFYPATIAAFDELNYVHRIEHDDGDIEPAVKLWEVQVNLRVEDDHSLQTPQPIDRTRKRPVESPEKSDLTDVQPASQRHTKKRSHSSSDNEERLQIFPRLREFGRRIISF